MQIYHVRALKNGKWTHFTARDSMELKGVCDRYGVDFMGDSGVTFSTVKDVIYLPISFVEWSGDVYRDTRIVIAVTDLAVVVLEPNAACVPVDLAIARMQRDRPGNSTSFEVAACILQAISDATDELAGQLSAGTEKMMLQTNSILKSLEQRKSRDFGVSDVSATQQSLSDMDELLARFMESQLALAESARYLRGSLRASGNELWTDINCLIEDIESIQNHVEFVHDRVRLLQQSNHLALNVKQNQIIKIFSVITAVFLPVMLLSTYYSMNIEYMPGLKWQYGEPVVIVASFIFAVLPLVYVRRRGWLR